MALPPTPPGYVRDAAELHRVLDVAKGYACQHCGRGGTFNGHGLLRGYSEAGAAGQVRGRRLLCSRRGRRPGCGRTWSILLAERMRGFIVTTKTLVLFAMAVVGGASRKAAWEQCVGGAMSLRSGYRLWVRLHRAQAALRAPLWRVSPPPPSESRHPLEQFLAHVHVATGGGPEHPPDAFARVQGLLQRPLLA